MLTPKGVVLILSALLILSIPGLSGASSKKEFVLTGKTMGTFYRIKFLTRKPISQSLWDKKVKIRLKEVNARLSMYQKDSEISRFNRTPEHQAFRLSKDFYAVLLQCRNLHRLSHGAWDGTVKPLVDLWGFGTREKTGTLPSDQDIRAALAKTGFSRLVLGEKKTLTKTVAGITLDLGSIAKGYGVDEIARLFAEAGIFDHLVEIGGELAAAGRNKKGNPWTVGITKPQKGTLNPGLYRVVSLDNAAIATSGNYRNFFEYQGKTYSHIINPQTGYPVENKVVSASVIAPDCTRADGLATALMVMDVDAGIALVNRLENTECLIIKKEGDRMVPVRSEGFKRFEYER
ncbi:MAG TPA: FAD:protein FMN transferase [Desulfobacteraceae bacterium]|nr:FAD:protein FMN transferase [Desulfobacteraceae bacterium]